MNILYASVVCSKSKFKELFIDSDALSGQAIQNYSRLLAEGLAFDNKNTVRVISELPVNESNCSQKYLGRKHEKKNGVEYIYLPLLNIHRVKDVLSVATSFLECIRYAHNDVDNIIISDILYAPIALGSYVASKIRKIPYVALVTDLPEYSFGKKDIAYKLVSSFLIKKASHYIFLSEQMNDVINIKNKPYVVIEGMTDIKKKNASRKRCNDKRVCLYTGNINRRNGISNLVKGFIKANIKDAELHICGGGDYANELKEIVKKHNNIKYFGLLYIDEVVKMQKRANLLINPRPSKADFTRYSFPSKTMEYMSSGTPVLMTNLPGVPGEYKRYVYLITDESVNGIANSLTEVLLKPESELKKRGTDAFSFVNKNKNNWVQSKKFLELIG